MTVINTNMKALQAQQAQVVTQRSLGRAIGQLATGSRVNSAADDAAGVAIISRMTAHVRGLDQAVRNANDGVSMIQTADGAAGGITDILMRMRELAVQSANDTNDSSDRTALQTEFSALESEITNMVANTTWNGQEVLSGSSTWTATYHVGAGSGQSMTVNFGGLGSGDLVASRSVSIQSDADSAISSIDLAIEQVNTQRSEWGAAINRLTYAADNASNVSMNLAESRSRVRDTDYARMTAELARAQIIGQAGTAMLSQANQQSYMVLALLR